MRDLTTTSQNTRTTARRRRIVVAAALAAAVLAGLAVGGPPRFGQAAVGAVADHPEFEVRCSQDACTVEVTYVLDRRADGHDVAIRWQTQPAAGLDDNDADTVHRSTTAGVGRPVGEDAGFRYTVHDLIWHSDIRCDDRVEITITRPDVASAVFTLTKPVPDGAGDAYCSDHGMDGEPDDH